MLRTSGCGSCVPAGAAEPAIAGATAARREARAGAAVIALSASPECDVAMRGEAAPAALRPLGSAASMLRVETARTRS